MTASPCPFSSSRRRAIFSAPTTTSTGSPASTPSRMNRAVAETNSSSPSYSSASCTNSREAFHPCGHPGSFVPVRRRSHSTRAARLSTAHAACSWNTLIAAIGHADAASSTFGSALEPMRSLASPSGPTSITSGASSAQTPNPLQSDWSMTMRYTIAPFSIDTSTIGPRLRGPGQETGKIR